MSLDTYNLSLDEVDLQLLDLLQRDARTTQVTLAKEVGLSQPAVAERVRKLEERAVIVGYVARVDPLALGKGITAFVGVGIEHPKYFDGFAQRVQGLQDVLECHRVAGDDSYLLKVRTESTRSLDQLLVEGLRTIPGVTRTHTTIVLSSIKEELRLGRAEQAKGLASTLAQRGRAGRGPSAPKLDSDIRPQARPPR